MSAIKNAGLKMFFPVFLLLIFSCKDSSKKVKNTGFETIEYVVYSQVGGKDGSYKTVKVTQDSIILNKGKTAFNVHKTWKTKLSEKQKKSIFNQLKVNQLAFIRSSASKQFKKEIDETFQVKTTKTSHVFVNAFNDEENYKQLKNFKTELDKLIPKEYGL